MRGEVDHSLNENVIEQNNFRDTLATFLSNLITKTHSSLVSEAQDGVKLYTTKRDKHFRMLKEEEKRKQEEYERKM